MSMSECAASASDWGNGHVGPAWLSERNVLQLLALIITLWTEKTAVAKPLR